MARPIQPRGDGTKNFEELGSARLRWQGKTREFEKQLLISLLRTSFLST